MNRVILWVQEFDWGTILLLCLTLGLAPFFPPHIFEKIKWLVNGTLTKPLDWFDLFFHGFPWMLALVKIIVSILYKDSSEI